MPIKRESRCASYGALPNIFLSSNSVSVATAHLMSHSLISHLLEEGEREVKSQQLAAQGSSCARLMTRQLHGSQRGGH